MAYDRIVPEPKPSQLSSLLSPRCYWEFGQQSKSQVEQIGHAKIAHRRMKNEEKYLDSLGAIHVIVSELDSTCYAIMGDWNANLSNTANLVFAQHMINF